jgi:tetratricopeptide (TPR) repeat protein
MIDFSGGAFAGGQLYVALSRCRSLKGMMLKTPVSPRDIIVNQEVVLFSREANRKELIEAELRKAKADGEYAAALHFFRENNWKEAVAAFARAVDYRNDLMKPEVQRFMVKEMRFISHYRHKIINLEAQLEENRKNIEEFAREYYLMANECESKFDDSRSAIANLNKAIKLNPEFLEALMRRASLLKNTGDLNAAEKDCNKILSIKQQNFKALFLRGKIRFELKKLEAAYQDLLEAANIRKNNPEVYQMLSKVCRRMGDDKKAKHYNNIAKSLEKDDE